MEESDIVDLEWSSDGGAQFDIALNGTNIATMTFPATATAGFASSTVVTVAQGDVLTLTPRTTDAQLADIAGFLALA